MAVRVESTRRRGVRGAMLALGVAATVVGCKDAEVTRIPTPIQVDLTSCLGDATGALPGGDQTTCRATLGAAVADTGTNACFVVQDAQQGASSRRTIPLRFANGALSLAAGASGQVDLSPGRDAQAALFFLDDVGSTLCTDANPTLQVLGACESAQGCVARLGPVVRSIPDRTADVKRDPDAVEPVEFAFVEGNGQCPVEWAVAAGTEACNDQDDDCDGKVDEDFLPAGGGNKGESCDNGEVGVCARDGVFVCAPDGAGTLCDAPQVGDGQRMEELREACADDSLPCCDGVDDDCDGNVDEGVPACCTAGQQQPCGTTVPNSECAAGTQVCDVEAGAQRGRWSACFGDVAGREPVVAPGDRPETCDHVDNDCDGNVDEDLFLGEGGPGKLQPCSDGVGVCEMAGLVGCAEGQPACCTNATAMGDCVSPAGTPAAIEACDSLDNDCDGSTDEDLPGLGEACDVGVGACANSGNLVCSPDSLIVCSVEPGMAIDELCGNGADDDCDGTTDEGYATLGDRCTVGLGECERTGDLVCAGDRLSVTCSQEPGPAGNEVCDLLDNDCDGRSDEDFDLGADIDNCGGCGPLAGPQACEGGGGPEACQFVCRPANAVPACNAGRCEVSSCVAGFVDVNGDPADGCECNDRLEDLPDPDFQDVNCDGVDGDANEAVFVSAERGSDNNAGRINSPYRTLAAALAIARATGADVYLDVGTYDVLAGQSVPPGAADGGLPVPSGVSIHGGYRYDGIRTWRRAGRAENETILTGNPVVLRYEGLTERTLLDNVIVRAEDQIEARMPSIAVLAVNVGEHLVVRDSLLESGRGGQGTASAEGQPGVDGSAGQPGKNGNAAICPGCGGEAGPVGAGTTCINTSAGSGGNGENAAGSDDDAQPGEDGNVSGGGAGGPAAEGNGDGQAGDPGDDAPAGANGLPADAFGFIDPATLLWTPREGTRGDTGFRGKGGGGGGGGGSAAGGVGGGGGGGGSGGCAGTAATPASGGGGSFSLVVIGGTVRVAEATLVPGRGGNGGAGGAGGEGGDGGPGADGGTGACGGGSCGDGGRGGDGSRGGCGGHAAGGPGGPSFAVLRVSTDEIEANIDASGVRFENYAGAALPNQGAAANRLLTGGVAGTPGSGGTRAGCGEAAPDGAAGPAGSIGCCARGAGAEGCGGLSCDP